jgi:hypothetical protein
MLPEMAILISSLEQPNFSTAVNSLSGKLQSEKRRPLILENYLRSLARVHWRVKSRIENMPRDQSRLQARYAHCLAEKGSKLPVFVSARVPGAFDRSAWNRIEYEPS